MVSITLQDKGISTDELAQTFKMYKEVKHVNASLNYIERLPANSPWTLVSLDLSYNQLTSLTGFDALVKLKHLNVSHNAISTTWGLSNNENLVTLDLSDNNIRVVEGLERHKKLEGVNFANNNLRSYHDVRSLSLNRSLKVANLQRTVLAGYKNFKFKIIHLLPHVKVIGNPEQR